MERSSAILSQLSEVLNETPDLEQALQQALVLVTGLVELESGWVWLKAKENDAFYLAAALHLPSVLLDPLHMTGRSCWCMDSMRKGTLNRKRVTVLECSRLRERGGTARYHATLPLVFDDRPLGIINLAGPNWRALDAQEIHWLSLAARQIALAVERAQLAEEQLGRMREQERLRFARDIHDRLAQSFAAIALQSEAALMAPPEAELRLRRILDIAREALEETRDSMLELRRGSPLSRRFRSQVQRFTYRSGVPVSLHLPDELQLHSAREDELEAILGEALRNVERHARARSVRVEVIVEDDLLRLTLCDDGIGFDPGSAPWKSGRYGLQGIQERVELLDGQLEIHSSAGHGTTVVVQVPL